MQMLRHPDVTCLGSGVCSVVSTIVMPCCTQSVISSSLLQPQTNHAFSEVTGSHSAFSHIRHNGFEGFPGTCGFCPQTWSWCCNNSSHLLTDSCVSGAVWGTFILTATLWNGYCCYPYFADERTEPWWGSITEHSVTELVKAEILLFKNKFVLKCSSFTMLC